MQIKIESNKEGERKKKEREIWREGVRQSEKNEKRFKKIKKREDWTEINRYVGIEEIRSEQATGSRD